MPRDIVLPGDVVEAMIDTFTMVCFFLEDYRMSLVPLSDMYPKEVILKWCVDDADYATFRQHGYHIRDIFAKSDI